jgi:hypothetical protein
MALLPSLLFAWVHFDWLGWSARAELNTKFFLFLSVPFCLAWLCAGISVAAKREFDRSREPPR